MDCKSVLITGCSSGIGRCLAEGLHQRGYRVIASVRQTKDLAALQQQGIECLLLDVRDSDSIRAAVATVTELTGGTLYALINNGAYAQPGAVEDLSRAALREQFETNLFGWHELTCQILPIMRRQGYGRVLQLSSLLGYVTLTYRGAYSASKYALEALTDTLRLELHGSGIYCCLIEPGPIESRIRANSILAYQRHIVPATSAHRRYYEAVEKRLEKEGHAAPFTLPPEAVLKKVIHALESRKPKARYRVTFPAHLFAWLKRLLPDTWLDALLRSI